MTPRRATRSKIRRLDRTSALERLRELRSSSLSLALTDLDGFAGLNDSLGRAAGDVVIEAWEAALQVALSDADLIARIGGDEYVIALVDRSGESALVALDAARQRLADNDALPAPITVSIGIASSPRDATSAADLWSAATQALMRAKRDGRNRVALHSEEKMVLKSSYYPRGTLERLAKLAAVTGRTEASLLREAIDDLLGKHGDVL